MFCDAGQVVFTTRIANQGCLCNNSDLSGALSTVYHQTQALLQTDRTTCIAMPSAANQLRVGCNLLMKRHLKGAGSSSLRKSALSSWSSQVPSPESFWATAKIASSLSMVIASKQIMQTSSRAVRLMLCSGPLVVAVVLMHSFEAHGSDAACAAHPS